MCCSTQQTNPVDPGRRQPSYNGTVRTGSRSGSENPAQPALIRRSATPSVRGPATRRRCAGRAAKNPPTKAQPPHRRDRTRVVRLDVRLQPMQPLFAEAVRHVQLDRLKFRVNFLPEECRQFRRDGVYLPGVRYWSPPCAGCRTSTAGSPCATPPAHLSRLCASAERLLRQGRANRRLAYPPVSLGA